MTNKLTKYELIELLKSVNIEIRLTDMIDEPRKSNRLWKKRAELQIQEKRYKKLYEI